MKFIHLRQSMNICNKILLLDRGTIFFNENIIKIIGLKFYKIYNLFNK